MDLTPPVTPCRFDYDVLHRKHWEHHNFTGQVAVDPDFHKGDQRLVPWFIGFLREYMTWMQVRSAAEG